MPVTRDQVDAARQDGYQAGRVASPPSPNPYAPPHVPAWELPRSPQARARFDRDRRPALILARMWRVGYSRGMADYGRATGRDWLVELATEPARR